MKNNDTKFNRTKKEINSSNIVLPSEKKEANSLLNILKKNSVDPEDFLVEFDYFQSAFEDLNKMSMSDEGYWELDHEIDMSAQRVKKMMKGLNCSGEKLFFKEIDNVRKYAEEKRKNLNEKTESMTYGGFDYTVIDKWQDDNASYVLGQSDDEDGTWYVAKVTEATNEFRGTYYYEFGTDKPNRIDVEDMHNNHISEIYLDRHEAEYGADGTRYFHNLDDPLSEEQVEEKNLINKEERTFCSIYCLSQHAHTYDKRELRNLDKGETVKKSYGIKDTIFSDREKALNKLEEYQTWLDFRNGETKVVEYAVSKVKYDITDLLKNGEVSSEDDFIEKISIYPNKFNEYETENEVLEISKMEFCVNVYNKDDQFDKKTSTYVLFGRYGEALDFAEDIQNGTYNDLDDSEIISKVLFRNENINVAAELMYPLFDDYTIMTSDEFDEMFEKRLNKFIENERSGQSM